MTSTLDVARGAFCGALVGDAAGAVLEFLDHRPSVDDVRAAWTMPGGGYWNVGPGQITDDGELAMSLAWALAGQRNPPEFDVEQVAQWYHKWAWSDPFDMGITTQKTLQAPQPDQVGGLARTMQRAAFRETGQSKSNGSLMRCVPLALWGRSLDDDQLAAVVAKDVSLTHSNPTVALSTTCYVLAIAHLVCSAKNTTDTDTRRHQAFARAYDWLQRQQHQTPTATDAIAEVTEWLKDARLNNVHPSPPKQTGFVKFAFTYAFAALLNGGDNFARVIQNTLLMGGDTDTNACIVGGMMGAVVGLTGIPADVWFAVSTPVTPDSIPRPDYLHPCHCLALVEHFMRL